MTFTRKCEEQDSAGRDRTGFVSSTDINLKDHNTLSRSKSFASVICLIWGGRQGGWNPGTEGSGSLQEAGRDRAGHSWISEVAREVEEI